jgi:hypothetical protein
MSENKTIKDRLKELSRSKRFWVSLGGTGSIAAAILLGLDEGFVQEAIDTVLSWLGVQQTN